MTTTRQRLSVYVDSDFYARLIEAHNLWREAPGHEWSFSRFVQASLEACLEAGASPPRPDQGTKKGRTRGKQK